MKRTKTGLLLAGVLTLLLWPACTASQETSWEKSNASGEEAYRQGRYAEAEEQLLAALQKAENSGSGNGRLATVLGSLSISVLEADIDVPVLEPGVPIERQLAPGL